MARNYNASLPCSNGVNDLQTPFLIQMVRRLVQKKRIWRGEQESSEASACALATRQGTERRVQWQVVEAHTGQRCFQSCL